MPDLVESMKKAAVEAVEATKPCNVAFGVVVSVDPLMVTVEQKMTLGANQLILSRNVTDYYVDVTIDWNTQNALKTHRHGIGTEEEMLVTMEGGDPIHVHDIPPSFTGYTNLRHLHGISGRKKMLVHSGLVLGDRVVMIRMQGGQQYLILDRVVG